MPLMQSLLQKLKQAMCRFQPVEEEEYRYVGLGLLLKEQLLRIPMRPFNQTHCTAAWIQLDLFLGFGCNCHRSIERVKRPEACGGKQDLQCLT